jgi:ribosome assembly protein YihI (activator of Der GTPase)
MSKYMKQQRKIREELEIKARSNRKCARSKGKR